MFTVVPPTNIAADPAGYDPARLARILRRHRRQHQRSTRELASRAGVSQAYVVALERNSVDIPPTPTVEVLVRLAAAMDRDPLDLFAACLRVRSRHVVLVTDVVTDETLAQAVGASGADECAWVWASSGASVPTAARHRIDLRRTAGTSYRPARIRQALQRELEHLGDLRDEELGFVFAETSAVMDSLDDPSVPGLARHLGNTRSAAAMELWRDRMAGAVVAIGNAPTSLFRLLEMLDEGAPAPAAVIGLPVGFVGAMESKQALAADGRVPFLIVKGRRGGSAMAVAAVNALASEAE